MAGLYIHIPFCARRCLYCDFYSNTDRSLMEQYVEAALRELEMESDYLQGEPIETIYFGGGTPSLLPTESIRRLLQSPLIELSADQEITLEANPDDLTPDYIAALRQLPINRISIGIQSFREQELLFLNRRHTAQQAIDAVKRCQDAGLTNISIDLMYGLPKQTPALWQQTLEAAVALQVPHLSAYHLIYEEGTALSRLVEAGKVEPIDEDLSVELFAQLIKTASQAGYEHYEISNFALPGCYSRHNSSYWQGKKYLGIGPSAHSFNGTERRWNASSLTLYIQGIREGDPDRECETLSLPTQYNEYIITRLRTRWGVDISTIQQRFGDDFVTHFRAQIINSKQQGLVVENEGNYCLTPSGIFLSDGVMSDLLWV